MRALAQLLPASALAGQAVWQQRFERRGPVGLRNTIRRVDLCFRSLGGQAATQYPWGKDAGRILAEGFAHELGVQAGDDIDVPGGPQGWGPDSRTIQDADLGTGPTPECAGSWCEW
jgi:hypothetical protein